MAYTTTVDFRGTTCSYIIELKVVTKYCFNPAKLTDYLRATFKYGLVVVSSAKAPSENFIIVRYGSNVTNVSGLIAAITDIEDRIDLINDKERILDLLLE